jgi:hypothetical protein
MQRAEDNAQWVRDKIKERGLEDWISTRTYAFYLKRYASQYAINCLFNEIVRSLSD